MSGRKIRSLAKPKKKKPVAPLIVDVNQRYTIPEATAILRQCRASTYNQIRSGLLRTITTGSRRYVPGSELIRMSTLPS